MAANPCGVRTGGSSLLWVGPAEFPVVSVPDFTALSQIADDPRFAIAAVVAVISGLVRGFSGFGSSLIYIPLISAIYEPKIAAPSILLIDTISSLPWAIKAAPESNWREILPVAVAGTLTLPLGVAALVYIDAIWLRWFISVLVLVALAALATGWRYHGRPTVLAAGVVGAASGFGSGSVQIAAPPLLIFWLGGQNSAATVRANVMVYFIWTGLLSMCAYFYSGLFTRETGLIALMLGIPFAAALAFGASRFHGTSDASYRRIAYIIIGLSGLLSLPLFDGLH